MRTVDEAALRAAITPAVAVRAIREAFRADGEGRTHVPAVINLAIPAHHGEFHVKSAYIEGVAAVSAALQPASPTSDVHRVTVERQTLRSRTLQARAGTDPHERVTGRRKQLHRHRIARHRRACLEA